MVLWMPTCTHCHAYFITGILAYALLLIVSCTNYYNLGEMWKDARSLMSFGLGAVACCIVHRSCNGRGPDASEDNIAVEKLQITACLI
mmetsp:Transcript_77102/g.121760  ORF Transcript_77102/g.121760 Transcript_77102/m.121760 type:complete len:88 (+) Transcript_77102:124-387(+)